MLRYVWDLLRHGCSMRLVNGNALAAALIASAHERGVRFLATRFSAKEAFSKAIGLGMRSPMTWSRCEIIPLPSGQPVINCHGALEDWMRNRRLMAKVSLSDESDYAVSFVVVEQADRAPHTP